jgi:hypothetical protein
VNLGIVNHTFAHFAPAGLELRLDQGNDISVGLEERRHHRQDLTERDERDINRDEVHSPWQIGERQATGIEPLDDDDTWIGAKPPIELAVSNIQRDDTCGAALKHDIGEPACRCTDIQSFTSGHLDTKRVERVCELQPATSDVRMIGGDQLERRAGVDTRAGFCHSRPIDADLCREDQRARTLARRRKASFDDQLVEASSGQG